MNIYVILIETNNNNYNNSLIVFNANLAEITKTCFIFIKDEKNWKWYIGVWKRNIKKKIKKKISNKNKKITKKSINNYINDLPKSIKHDEKY